MSEANGEYPPVSGSDCLPIGSENIPLFSILTVDGWLPPNKQPLAVRVGLLVGAMVARDAIETTMAVIHPNVSAEDRRACEPYPPAPCWPHLRSASESALPIA